MYSREGDGQGRVAFEEGSESAWLQACDLARTQLARELHDRAGWYLTAINYDLFALENNPLDLHKIATLRRRLNALNDALHGLLSELRNEGAMEAGFVEGISELLREWTQVTQIPAVLEVATEPLKIGSHCAEIATAVLTELLTNVAKHAPEATCVRALIQEHSDGAVCIEFRDDGEGIDLDRLPGRDREHFGLTGICERLAVVKGTLKIERALPRGTLMSIHIPDARL